MIIDLWGYGSAGHVFAEAIQQSQVWQLGGIYDISGEGSYSCEADLLGSDSPVVLLSVPVEQQFHCLSKIAAKKKHCICQSPIALSSKQLSTVKDQFSAEKCILLPAQYDTNFKNIIDVKKQLSDNRIGRVGVVNMRCSCAVPSPTQKWYLEDQKSGGLPYQCLLNGIGIIRYWLGDIEHGYCTGKNTGRVAYASAIMKMCSGAVVSLTADIGYSDNFQTAYELSGEAGNISFCSHEVGLIAHGASIHKNAFNMDCTLCSATHNPYKLMLEEAYQHLQCPHAEVLDYYAESLHCLEEMIQP